MTPTISKRYHVERRRFLHRRTVSACILGMILVPLFAPIDYFVYRPYLAILSASRLASFLLSVVVLVLLRRRFGKRYAYELGILLAIGAALAVACIPIAVTGIDTPHYVSLSLLMFAVAALLPLYASQFALLSALLTAMFVGCTLLHGQIPSTMVVMMQLSAVAATGSIGVVIAYLSEGLRFREFEALRAAQLASLEKTVLIGHLRDKTAQLEEANQELAVLNQEMEDILYVSSHDLRAPLINVQGFANEVGLGLADLRPHVSDGPEAERVRGEIQESLTFIQSAVTRMDALITGLLNVSRVATRTNPTEEVRLQPAIETIVESFRYQLEQRGIAVTVGELATVRGDPVRLNQVFSNLVDNAIKYMGESARREIAIGMRGGNGAGPIFFVSDTGPGIAADNHETVFRLFRRLANGAGVPGEGLGLAMVRKIVEKHGGRIWVESAPGEGTTFCFTLSSRSHTESARSEAPDLAPLAATG